MYYSVVSLIYCLQLLFCARKGGTPGLVQAAALHPELKHQYGWCAVAWHKGNANLYRLGDNGNVDVIAIEPGNGGYYYPNHLASLGNVDSFPEAGKHHVNGRSFSTHN
jgi:hypothetical protein